MATRRLTSVLIFLAALAVAGGVVRVAIAAERSFTVVVISDTQNYVDFTLQKSTGFALDSSELFIEQMRHIASKSAANGGDVVFAAAVGDVWQHVFSDTDPEHSRRGVTPAAADLGLDALVRPDETRTVEIPKAIEGYRLLSAAGIPFGVPPGNHDYDAWWPAQIPGTPAGANAASGAALQIHIGGLDAFRRAFGRDSEFFRGKDWYVGAHDGGTSSAQVFSAGGYRFLHLAFEMQAGDAVLAWAQQMLDAYPNLPTIISTHDFLSARGERRPAGNMDLAAVDPGYNNSAEQIWQKFISRNDQVFMVLSGHQLGQARRIDRNVSGHAVYQMLSDYQGRGQAGLDAGQPRDADGGITGIGDGWYRELAFHVGGDNPRVEVKTYSTHYRRYSGELSTYAEWYRPMEQPGMSDAEFLQADDFTLRLDDFYERYGQPK